MEYNDTKIAAKYLDFSKREADWGRFNVVKELAEKMPNYKGAVILDEAKSMTETGLILKYVKSVKPINIYKTLCKCVIGVIDDQQRKFFNETFKWIRYDFHSSEKLPIVRICKYCKVCITPQIMIYIRNNEKVDLPYCFADFRIANYSFLFIIPFVSKDTTDFSDKKNFECFIDQLDWVNKTFYTNYDFSSSDCISINNILSFESPLQK